MVDLAAIEDYKGRMPKSTRHLTEIGPSTGAPAVAPLRQPLAF